MDMKAVQNICKFIVRYSVECIIGFGYNRIKNKEGVIMPNIKPISDLRDYTAVLDTVLPLWIGREKTQI